MTELKRTKYLAIRRRDILKILAGGPAIFSVMENTMAATLTGTPINLIGDPPQENILTLNITDYPTYEFIMEIVLQVFDADGPNQGELHVNDNFCCHVFDDGNTKNNNVVADVSVLIPGNLLQEGDNILKFIHTQKGGFRVQSASTFNILQTPKQLLLQISDAFNDLSSKL